jgi:hypothetical protein
LCIRHESQQPIGRGHFVCVDFERAGLDVYSDKLALIGRAGNRANVAFVNGLARTGELFFAVARSSRFHRLPR